jgi:hypothetical protein
MGKQVMLGEEGNLQALFEREYSDTLLIVMLKAFRPEKYRERVGVKAEWDGQSVLSGSIKKAPCRQPSRSRH